MVLYLELLAELSDHLVIEIGTIVCNDPFRDTITKDEVVSDECGYHILGD